MNTLIEELKKQKFSDITLSTDVITQESLLYALNGLDNRLSSVDDPYSSTSGYTLTALYNTVKEIIRLFSGPKS